MPSFSNVNTTSRKTVAVILVMAMLCAQWVGLAHRIAHADGPHTFASTARYLQAANLVHQITHGNEHLVFGGVPIDHYDAGHDTHHSCSLFDAATLASSVHSAPFLLPAVPNVQVLALWIAFISWHAPFTCHFSSRAPPHA